MSGELIFLIGVILVGILFYTFIHISDIKQLKNNSKRLEETFNQERQRMEQKTKFDVEYEKIQNDLFEAKVIAIIEKYLRERNK